MKKLLLLTLMLITLVIPSSASSKKLSVNADADVWYDFQEKTSFNSHYILIDFANDFSSTVSATVEAAIITLDDDGNVIYPPAGASEPSNRWTNIAFNGAWITWNSPLKVDISVGDLVYNYGTFNYYLYKNSSMITKQFFPRGIELSKSISKLQITGFAGALDDEKGNATVGINGVYSITDKINLNVVAVGTKQDTSTNSNVGAEFNGDFGSLSLKADIGDINNNDHSEITALIEPSLSLGKFSIAGSFFYRTKNDSSIDFLPEENWFTYLEPGISINKYLSFGLPIEYHVYDDEKDNNQFWLVPTIYVQPSKDINWCVWGQMVNSKADGNDFYMGSEITFNF